MENDGGVYAKHIDLFRLFTPGEEIKILKSDINNFTGCAVKETLSKRKYRVVQMFKHFFLCLNEYGTIECISKGELVQNHLI